IRLRAKCPAPESRQAGSEATGGDRSAVVPHSFQNSAHFGSADVCDELTVQRRSRLPEMTLDFQVAAVAELGLGVLQVLLDQIPKPHAVELPALRLEGPALAGPERAPYE